MNLNSLINRLNIINPDKWTQKFVNKYNNNIKTSIITLPKGTLLYRDDESHYGIGGEAQVPLHHFHNYKIIPNQKTFRTVKDLRIYKCELQGVETTKIIQPHYILYKLTNSNNPQDWKNKESILNILNNLNCVGTMEQSVNNKQIYEICIPQKYVQKVNIDTIV